MKLMESVSEVESATSILVDSYLYAFGFLAGAFVLGADILGGGGGRIFVGAVVVALSFAALLTPPLAWSWRWYRLRMLAR